MELQLKHLAPYLPYGLKFSLRDESYQIQGLKYNEDLDKEIIILYTTGEYYLNQVKPILHPLSDLTKEIEHNGEMKEIQEIIFGHKEIWSVWKNLTGEHTENFALSIKQMLMLFEYHFDVFGLIPAGLAIDINQAKN